MIGGMTSWKKIAWALLLLWASTCSSSQIPNSTQEGSGRTLLQAPLSNPSLQFFTFGDWGSGDSNQRAVADALRNFCNSEPCDFGLLLGDNFYDFGVDSVQDPLWDARFEQMYQGLELPFYAILGNHDHEGNAQAQIDYTYLPDQDRWKMPAREFTVRYAESGADPLIEIFALDSEFFSKDDADLLSEDINTSRAKWKVLALHLPIYSNGSHGDTEYLIDFVLPVICRKVDVVLAGHDHLFSHLMDSTDGCDNHHLIVGTGGKDIFSFRPDPRVLFTLSEFGFASLRVSPSEILIRFHKTDGSIPYEFQLQK